ncbi:ATP-binding protein [Methanoregula sp.]|uniref:ATP-binding protein n=1 Tax=Methanoregula sp. TaxID=2052170 RepID=UPI0025F996C5|nr:ATP-binding protein [Methanoregula sp.]
MRIPPSPKVFYNLVDNAVRHGTTLTQVSFRCEWHNDIIRIICEDNSVGVPVILKRGIFNREYFKNTAFGLNLSREILAITALSIVETDEQGKGARFEIVVPKGAYRLPEAKAQNEGKRVRDNLIRGRFKNYNMSTPFLSH